MSKYSGYSSYYVHLSHDMVRPSRAERLREVKREERLTMLRNIAFALLAIAIIPMPIAWYLSM